jgi:hypothetical protein
MATNGHVKLCTQSRLAETDCRAFRPLLVWSVTPSEAKQIQNCCQNPWIASSPCGLAMTVGDPTKIGTPFSSASSSCCGGSTCGAAWVWVWRHRPIVQPNHRRPPPGKAPLWFHSRTRRQGPGPQIPISPSWRARELFFFTAFSIHGRGEPSLAHADSFSCPSSSKTSCSGPDPHCATVPAS